MMMMLLMVMMVVKLMMVMVMIVMRMVNAVKNQCYSITNLPLLPILITLSLLEVKISIFLPLLENGETLLVSSQSAIKA